MGSRFCLRSGRCFNYRYHLAFISTDVIAIAKGSGLVLNIKQHPPIRQVGAGIQQWGPPVHQAVIIATGIPQVQGIWPTGKQVGLLELLQRVPGRAVVEIEIALLFPFPGVVHFKAVPWGNHQVVDEPEWRLILLLPNQMFRAFSDR